jgi:hypothetical protein
MIQVVDATGGATTAMQHLGAVIRLLDAVRSGDPETGTPSFLAHLRAVVAETNSAMSDAIAALGAKGSLDDGEFSRLLAAGSAHGVMLGFCRTFEQDPSDGVRMACAAGEMILAGVDKRPEAAAVLRMMNERLERMS